MKSLKIGLVGLGTVGTGVTHILIHNKDIIEKRIGCPVEIKKICVKDLKKKREIDISGDMLTTDPQDLIDDPEIDVIVEVVGGIDFAKSIIEAAFKNGKHVVSANKDLISQYGKDLFELAKQNHCHFLFEASVAGGIPILRPLQYALTADHIQKIGGIINGSTNYILTRMEKDGLTLEEVLKEASELGFLEADPSSDLDGYDAARKCAILATIGFHSPVLFEDVYCEDIRRLSLRDMECAKFLGYSIKLLAVTEDTDEGIVARVHPALIPLNHPLAAVNYELNAVYVVGDMLGETMYYGKGAGSLPTGSAVVSDIVTVGRKMRKHNEPEPAYDFYEKKKILPVDQLEFPYYIRVIVGDDENAMSNIIRSLEYYRISIYSVNQWQIKHEGKIRHEYVFITNPSREIDCQRALEEIEVLPTTIELANAIKIERGL